jgi:hypothetical protein
MSAFLINAAVQAYIARQQSILPAPIPLIAALRISLILFGQRGRLLPTTRWSERRPWPYTVIATAAGLIR